MDLSFLDKSSGITPLLVKLYDSHKIYSLAKDKKPLAQTELIGAISELLGMDLSSREKELIADVMVALIRQAEADLKAAMSEHLSRSERVPLRIILQIANEEIDIARPVLKHSPVLGDLDLIYIIKSKTSQYWLEIAKRKEMSDHVIEVLAETEDFDTAMSLVSNQEISLTQDTMNILSGMIEDHKNLARPLLSRDEVTQEIAQALYEYVGEELRADITNRFKVGHSQVINETIGEILVEFEECASAVFVKPEDGYIANAQVQYGKGLLTIDMILGNLKRNQLKTFVAQLAIYAGVNADDLIQILMQEHGQGLAVIAKACGISKQNFMSMFLLTNRMRNEGAMVDVGEMNKAARYYERISEAVAQDILKNAKHNPRIH